MLTLLIYLLAGHALADYPLQGEFLSKAKNRTTPIPGVPWWHALSAHSAIHGGVVTFLTGQWYLGVAEFLIHAITDDAKCRGKITYNQDQAIHIVCKLIWFVITIYLKGHGYGQ